MVLGAPLIGQFMYQTKFQFFLPIVWTNGTNKANQPDLADLQTKCKQGQTIEHKVKMLPQLFFRKYKVVGYILIVNV